MSIEITISTFTTGENTETDNRTFGENVEAAVRAEYPSEKVSVEFSDKVTTSQIYVIGDGDATWERVYQIINEVWNS